MYATLRALPMPGPAFEQKVPGLKSAMKRCPSSSERSPPVEKSKRRVLFDLEQTEVRYLPREPSEAAQAAGPAAAAARPDKAELAAFFQRQCASLMQSRERLQEQRERRLALSPSLGGAATPARGAAGAAGAPAELEPAAAVRGIAPSVISTSMHLLLLKQQQQQQLLHSGQQERGSKLGFDKGAAPPAADEPLVAESAARSGRASGRGGLGLHSDFSSCSLPAHGHHRQAHGHHRQAHSQRSALLGKLATDSLLVDRERRDRLHNLRASSGDSSSSSSSRAAPALQDLPYILQTNGAPLDVSAPPRQGPARGRENRSEAPRPLSCNGTTNMTLLSARAIAATKAGSAPARGAFAGARRGPGSSALSAGAVGPGTVPGWQAVRNGAQGAPGYLTLSRMPAKGLTAMRELDGPGSSPGPQVKKALSLSGETWPMHVFKLQPIAC